MLGYYSQYASEFLTVAAGFALLLGGPMLVTPIGWAKVLGWRIPEHTDLAVYFGRCLGGVVTMMAVFALVAVRRPLVQPFFFQFVLAAVAVNIAVHAYGAVKRIQPMSETWEILGWVALLAAGIVFYPV